MQKRGATESDLDGAQPNKRARQEESTELAILPQTSNVITVKSDEVCNIS